MKAELLENYISEMLCKILAWSIVYDIIQTIFKYMFNMELYEILVLISEFFWFL